MIDIDITRLRELAQAATTIEVVESIPQDGFECYWLRVGGREIGSINGPQCDERDGWATYIAAMSPDVTTALCDRIESLERTAAAAGMALKEANRQVAELTEERDEAVVALAKLVSGEDARYVSAKTIADGCVGAVFVGNAGPSAVTLDYRTFEQAEAAYGVLNDAIDAARKEQA